MNNLINPLDTVFSELSKLGKLHPEIWQIIDKSRSIKGQKIEDQSEIIDWPDWCFLPYNIFVSIIKYLNNIPENTPLSNQLQEETELLAIYTTWRVTQGIYRFDPDIYKELLDTPFDDKIPANLFFFLPEWCIYIETPKMFSPYGIQYGAFARLEHDMSTKNNRLCIMIKYENRSQLYIINIGGNNTILEAMDEKAKYINFDVNKCDGKTKVDSGYKHILPILSLLMYICTQNADFDGKRPERPVAIKTKKCLRYFPPEKPLVWDVGIRLGAAIRNYRANEARTEGGIHHSPRPHIRRAHWHSFWKGKRNNEANRKIVVKWIPPVPVNLEEGEVIPTIHPIQE